MRVKRNRTFALISINPKRILFQVRDWKATPFLSKIKLFSVITPSHFFSKFNRANFFSHLSSTPILSIEISPHVSRKSFLCHLLEYKSLHIMDYEDHHLRSYVFSLENPKAKIKDILRGRDSCALTLSESDKIQTKHISSIFPKSSFSFLSLTSLPLLLPNPPQQ